MGVELYCRKGITESELKTFTYLLSQQPHGRLYITGGTRLRYLCTVSPGMNPRTIY